MATYKANRGFTLIEIVLVIVIAGLLLLMVIWAISGAQRARRDAQRKSDLASLVAAVEQWRGNNGGSNLDSQADLDQVATGYMAGRSDPGVGTAYALQYLSAATPHASVTPPAPGWMTYMVGHVCGSDVGGSTLVTSLPGAPHGVHQFVVLVTLESGGAFCLDSR